MSNNRTDQNWMKNPVKMKKEICAEDPARSTQRTHLGRPLILSFDCKADLLSLVSAKVSKIVLGIPTLGAWERSSGCSSLEVEERMLLLWAVSWNHMY